MLIKHLLERDNSDFIISKLQDAKARLKLIKTQAASGNQSGIAPQYRDRIDQVQREIAVLQQEYQQSLKTPDIILQQRTAQADVANTIANRTPEELKAAFSQSISSGMAEWAKLRDQLGGDEGLDAAIIKAAKSQTQSGQYELDVDQLATEFNVPTRSMYKRLERVELAPAAMLMPKNRR